MANFTKIARLAYCVGLAGMVIPQIVYRQFGGNFLPPWPGLPWVPFWACVFTVITLAACVAIALEIKGRAIALLLGGLLLTMTILGGVPYELFFDPNKHHFIYWAGVLSGLAIAGGAFVVAGTFKEETNVKKSSLLRLLEKIIPFGGLFFCITMIGYGWTHFLYPDMVSGLFPNWMPYQMFWLNLAGVALIVGGFAIIFHIKVKLAGMLLGILLFLFLILIHIPLAIADPWGQNAFQSIRIFGALAFIGTAFMIAGNATPKG